jgi:hypothetical protein
MNGYQMTENGWDKGGTWPDKVQGGEGVAEVEKEKAVKEGRTCNIDCYEG